VRDFRADARKLEGRIMRHTVHNPSRASPRSGGAALSGLLLAAFIASASALALQACVPAPPSGLDGKDPDAEEPGSPAPPARGSITARISTAGPEAPDSLRLELADAPPEMAPASGEHVWSGLEPGTYGVEVAALPANCSVVGANPRDVVVTAGDDTEISFGVICVATVGEIHVTVATHGAGTDRNGYRLELGDKLETREIGVNDEHTFDGLAPGSHEVRLRDVHKDCDVEGDDRLTADVSAGVRSDIAFTVECDD
jgi:hypothetical protein